MLVLFRKHFPDQFSRKKLDPNNAQDLNSTPRLTLNELFSFSSDDCFFFCRVFGKTCFLLLYASTSCYGNIYESNLIPNMSIIFIAQGHLRTNTPFKEKQTLAKSL